MSDKQVLRWINPDAAEISIPRDENLRITHVGLGVYRELSSYPTSNGGAVTHSHDYYDFCMGIDNTSTTDMRVRVVLGEQDRDGYLIRKFLVLSDIGPSEKQRVWANLRVENQVRFQSLLIMEVSVGFVRKLLADDDAWNDTTYPKRNLFDAFQLATNRLPVRVPQQFVLPLIVGGVVLVIFLYFWISYIVANRP